MDNFNKNSSVTLCDNDLWKYDIDEKEKQYSINLAKTWSLCNSSSQCMWMKRDADENDKMMLYQENKNPENEKVISAANNITDKNKKQGEERSQRKQFHDSMKSEYCKLETTSNTDNETNNIERLSESRVGMLQTEKSEQKGNVVITECISSQDDKSNRVLYEQQQQQQQQEQQQQQQQQWKLKEEPELLTFSFIATSDDDNDNNDDNDDDWQMPPTASLHLSQSKHTSSTHNNTFHKETKKIDCATSKGAKNVYNKEHNVSNTERAMTSCRMQNSNFCCHCKENNSNSNISCDNDVCRINLVKEVEEQRQLSALTLSYSSNNNDNNDNKLCNFIDTHVNKRNAKSNYWSPITEENENVSTKVQKNNNSNYNNNNNNNNNIMRCEEALVRRRVSSSQLSLLQLSTTLTPNAHESCQSHNNCSISSVEAELPLDESHSTPCPPMLKSTSLLSESSAVIVDEFSQYEQLFSHATSKEVMRHLGQSKESCYFPEMEVKHQADITVSTKNVVVKQENTQEERDYVSCNDETVHYSEECGLSESTKESTSTANHHETESSLHD